MSAATETDSVAVRGRVVAIRISAGHNFFGRHGKGALDHAARAVEAVDCVAGKGLRGDRFFDHKENYKGQVTFFAVEVFAALTQALGVHDAEPSAVRRNVFTEGIDLNSLIGKPFTLQGIHFLGTEECRPCAWMDTALGPGAHAFLKGQGGLRARILSDGVLRTE